MNYSLKEIGLSFNPFLKNGTVTKPEDVKVFWCIEGKKQYNNKIEEWIKSPYVKVLCGTVGLGKTHTLFYIKNYLEDTHPDYLCLNYNYLDIKNGFIIKIIKQIKSSKMHEEIEKALVDVSNKDPYEEIGKIIEFLSENNKKIIIMIDQFEDIFEKDENKIINIDVLQEIRQILDYSLKYSNPINIFIGATDDAWEACINKYEALSRRYSRENLILIDKQSHLKQFTKLYLSFAKTPESTFKFGPETLKELLKKTGGREDKVVRACYFIIDKICEIKPKSKDLTDKKIKEIAELVFDEIPELDIIPEKEKLKKKPTQTRIDSDTEVRKKVFEALRMIPKIKIDPPSVNDYHVDTTKNIYSLKLGYLKKFKGKWSEVFIEYIDDEEEIDKKIKRNKEGFTLVISSAEEDEGENYRIISIKQVESMYKETIGEIKNQNKEILKEVKEEQIINHPAVAYLLSKKLGLFE